VLDRAASPTDKEHDHVGSPRTHAPLAMTRPSAAEIQSLDPYAFLAVLGKRVICVLAAATARAAADPGGGDDRHAVIAAATVAGGAGGGGGHDERGQEGEGGGFGVSARPAGAYVIKDGRVRWRPAVDVNRLVATVGAVAIAYLFTRARIEKARARAAIHTPDGP
jgi:hypothetical protein